MPNIKITGTDDRNRTVEVRDDMSLMEAIRENGFDELLSICGGCCSCATCHVYIDSDHIDRLEKMSEDENDLLESSSHRQPTSRLSCQIRISDALEGLEVTIAPMD